MLGMGCGQEFYSGMIKNEVQGQLIQVFILRAKTNDAMLGVLITPSQNDQISKSIK
jgi:hypothetical protein